MIGFFLCDLGSYWVGWVRIGLFDCYLVLIWLLSYLAPGFLLVYWFIVVLCDWILIGVLGSY